MEFPENSDEIVLTLNSTETYFSRCVGYCHYHKVYLTQKQLKGKECLKKGCRHLERTGHQFWKEREAKRKHQKEAQFAVNAHIVPEKEPKTPVRMAQKPKRFVCLDLEMCDLTPSERKAAKGLPSEIIQIGAVMLDENYNCISQFSTLVKPIYGKVSEIIENLTGITNENLENADIFSTAIRKLYAWLGEANITTFCWSDSDYKQLYDETYVKAKNHSEYFDFYRTFVDLQKTFGILLNATQSVSLDSALKFSHLKFSGNRHSAISDAFNTARILHKICLQDKFNPKFEKIHKTTETFFTKSYEKSHSIEKDYTATFASFMPQELLEKFASDTQNEATAADSSEKTDGSGPKTGRIETKSHKKHNLNWLQKKFTCTNYGIRIRDWAIFSIKMRLTKDMETLSAQNE